MSSVPLDHVRPPVAIDSTGSRRCLWAAILIVATICAYWPAMHGGYLWDDDANVTRPQLRSLSGLGRIWFQLGTTQTYYPLMHTVWWVESQLWDDHTLGYHLANVMLHLVCVALFYAVLCRLQIPGAYLAAFLFALHPIYVESVAWITEQKNTLSSAFCLGSILVYLQFDERRTKASYVLALLLFVLSLLTKTITVTLPLALVVILWWRRPALAWRRDLRPLLPWLGLSLMFGVFTIWYERAIVGASGAEFTLSLTQRCLVAGRALWFYLGKLFWPSDLTLFYPLWQPNAADAWQYAYPLCFLALLAGAWSIRGLCRGLIAALALFVVTLFPLLGFFQTYIFRYTYVCDHFQYLASLGIVALVAAAVARGIAGLAPVLSKIAMGGCALVVGLLAVLTWQQCHRYQDAVTFYRYVLERNPDCFMAYNNLGLLLGDEIGPTEASKFYRHALELNPNYAEAHNNLGLALMGLGQIPEAIEQYHLALEANSKYPSAHVNLGNALKDSGQLAEAIEEFQRALAIQPNDVMAFYNLGNAMLEQNDLAKAIGYYQQALEIQPDLANAHYNLGIALVRTGQMPQAIAEFRQAIHFQPNFAEAYNNLGNALFDAGQLDDAAAQFREEIRLKPGDLPSYAKLAKTYALLDRRTDAIETARKALEIARSADQQETAEQIKTWLEHYTSGDPSGSRLPPESEKSSAK